MAPTTAAIRLPRVEALLGGSIDPSLPGEAIDRLVAEGVAEFEQLDFKREMYKADPTGRAELAKDVAAFANQVGGLLVCGVADVKGVASKTMPWPASDADVRHVHSVVATYCSPLPHVEAFVVTSTAGADGYLLIAVAPSPWGPHAVSEGESLNFPVRNGSATRYLRQPELADRYRNRFDSAASQISRLDDVVGEAADEMHRHAPWTYVATVPNVLGHRSITASTRSETARWMFQEAWRGPLDRDIFTESQSIGVGRVVTAFRSQPGAPAKGLYAELHADGSGFAAYQADPAQFDSDVNLWMLGENESADLAVALTALVAQHAARWAGQPGDGVAEMGILAVEGDPPAPQMALGGERRHTFGPLTDRRVVAGPRSRHSIDLGAASSDVTELLVTARILLTSTVQAFGVAEVEHFDAEGQIRPSRFGADWSPVAAAWARRHGAKIIP